MVMATNANTKPVRERFRRTGGPARRDAQVPGAAPAFAIEPGAMSGRPVAIGYIVDFGGCPYIGSAGLRVILTIAKLLRGRDAGLALCGLSDPIHEMFRIGGFDRLVPIYDTRADARVALGV